MFRGFEYINCPLCGWNNTKLRFLANVLPHQKGIFSFDVWNIVNCNNCGFVYVNPRITEKVNDEYYKFKLKGDQDFIIHHFIESADYHLSYWRRMIRVIKKFKKFGNLLDVGCGSGDFLIAAQAAGYRVFGQDISDYFIEFNRKENNIIVFTEELKKLNLQRNSFDVVSCFDVIEHHRNPMELLSEIKTLLKPDGILIISTHDISNIFAKFYGKKWRMIYPIGHLTYFTRRTMKRMLSELGYEIIRITGANYIDDNKAKEIFNYVQSIFKTIILRAIILLVYKPFMDQFPALQRWKIKVKGMTLTHELIIFLAGNQIIFNDELISIARLNINIPQDL